MAANQEKCAPGLIGNLVTRFVFLKNILQAFNKFNDSFYKVLN